MSDLVIFTEEILNGKLHFCVVKASLQAGGRSSKVLGILNPFVDSDDEDEIFLVFLILLQTSGV